MTEIAASPISARIAAARKASGLKAHQLAQLIGVQASQLSRWENRTAPKAHLIPLIAQHTGVSVAWLLTGEGKGPAVDSASAAA